MGRPQLLLHDWRAFEDHRVEHLRLARILDLNRSKLFRPRQLGLMTPFPSQGSSDPNGGGTGLVDTVQAAAYFA